MQGSGYRRDTAPGGAAMLSKSKGDSATIKLTGSCQKTNIENEADILLSLHKQTLAMVDTLDPGRTL
jgi:hypothetical protein